MGSRNLLVRYVLDDGVAPATHGLIARDPEGPVQRRPALGGREATLKTYRKSRSVGSSRTVSAGTPRAGLAMRRGKSKGKTACCSSKHPRPGFPR